MPYKKEPLLEAAKALEKIRLKISKKTRLQKKVAAAYDWLATYTIIKDPVEDELTKLSNEILELEKILMRAHAGRKKPKKNPALRHQPIECAVRFLSHLALEFDQGHA